MGIRLGIGGLKIGQRSGTAAVPFDWSSYWATLISATVEDAAPTHVVLTFAAANPLVTSADFTIAGYTVNSGSWAGAVFTIVLAENVVYGDTLIVTFTKSGGTAAVTNNVLSYSMLLTSTGTGAGVSTVAMQVSSNIIVTLGANAKFYSDAAGTLDESATWTITSGAIRTYYLKCTTGTALMTFSDITKLTSWGNHTTQGWSSSTNAARISGDLTRLTSLLNIHWVGNATITSAMPSSLIVLRMNAGWTYSGALPNGLTYLTMMSDVVNWTGLDIGSGGNIWYLSLTNYRTAKMSSADMVTLLTQMTGRTGTLPATITINDYADYASPPAEVVNAVNALKAAKSITTVNLGA